jgi:hypothetical protein
VKNDLESYLYTARDKLTEEEFLAVLSEDEKSSLTKKLTATQEWFETTDSTEVEEYNEKLRKLREKVIELTER